MLAAARRARRRRREERRRPGRARRRPRHGSRPSRPTCRRRRAATQLGDAVDVVDILVNNAGFGSAGRVRRHAARRERPDGGGQRRRRSRTSRARWLPGMVSRGAGRIVNVASTAAFQPGPMMAVYYATKAYVLSFTEAIAEELRGTRGDRDGVLPRRVRERLPGGRGHGDRRGSSGAGRCRRPPRWRARRSTAMDRGVVVARAGRAQQGRRRSRRASRPRPVVRRMVRGSSPTSDPRPPTRRRSSRRAEVASPHR